MKIKVEMIRFAEGKHRFIELTDAEYHKFEKMGGDAISDKIYLKGQKPDTELPSVSMGDVINLPDGRKMMVVAFGFEELTDSKYQCYKSLSFQAVSEATKSGKSYSRVFDDLVYENFDNAIEIIG